MVNNFQNLILKDYIQKTEQMQEGKSKENTSE